MNASSCLAAAGLKTDANLSGADAKSRVHKITKSLH